jgi:hypothetical protein
LIWTNSVTGSMYEREKGVGVEVSSVQKGIVEEKGREDVELR